MITAAPEKELQKTGLQLIQAVKITEKGHPIPPLYLECPAHMKKSTPAPLAHKPDKRLTFSAKTFMCLVRIGYNKI